MNLLVLPSFNRGISGRWKLCPAFTIYKSSICEKF